MSEAQRVAVVTGGGSGIGRLVAQEFCRAGYRVVVTGRRQDALEETLAQCSPPGSALAITADVRDEASVQALFGQVQEAFGRVDVLFNNAGVMGSPTPFADLDLATWNTVVDTNLTGAFLCAREACRMMRDQQPQGGRIINNGSLSAHVPRPRSAAYTAAKHAMSGLTKAIALEGRAYNVACSQIDIGNADTEMAAGLKTGAWQADGHQAPEPTMDPQHAASAVLYIASLPPEANVHSLVVMATKMPFLGRG